MKFFQGLVLTAVFFTGICDAKAARLIEQCPDLSCKPCLKGWNIQKSHPHAFLPELKVTPATGTFGKLACYYSSPRNPNHNVILMKK